MVEVKAHDKQIVALMWYAVRWLAILAVVVWGLWWWTK